MYYLQYFNSVGVFWPIIKNSQRRCSVKKSVLRNFAKFTLKSNCARVSFLIKLQVSATLLKNRLWHRCFPVNFVKFLRIPFFIEHLLADASTLSRMKIPNIITAYKTAKWEKLLGKKKVFTNRKSYLENQERYHYHLHFSSKKTD